MALTLVVETGAGLANANTFVSLATATTLLEASPFGAAWALELDDARKNQCLAEATAWLSQLPWHGIATTATQALAFPRAWLETPDGYAVASNLVPTWLQQATARLALFLLEQDVTPFSDSGLAPGTEIALPSGLRLTPSSGATMPPDVRALVGLFIHTRRSLVRA